MRGSFLKPALKPGSLLGSRRSEHYSTGLLKGWHACKSYLSPALPSLKKDWQGSPEKVNRALTMFLQWLYESKGASGYELGNFSLHMQWDMSSC